MFSLQNEKISLLLRLYQQESTVFRLKDVAMLTGETDRDSLNKKLHYYVKTGRLGNPRKGIYVKNEYSPKELACSIFSPAYLSLEYVLQKAGVVFQYDEQYTVVSYLSRSIEVDGYQICYRRIKEDILFNPNGLLHKKGKLVEATPERAFLDLLYLEKEYHFDYLDVLDQSQIKQLLPLYASKAVNRKVEKLLYHG